MKHFGSRNLSPTFFYNIPIKHCTLRCLLLYTSYSNESQRITQRILHRSLKNEARFLANEETADTIDHRPGCTINCADIHESNSRQVRHFQSTASGSITCANVPFIRKRILSQELSHPSTENPFSPLQTTPRSITNSPRFVDRSKKKWSLKTFQNSFQASFPSVLSTEANRYYGILSHRNSTTLRGPLTRASRCCRKQGALGEKARKRGECIARVINW